MPIERAVPAMTPGGLVFVEGVHVLDLDLGHLTALGHGDLADLVLVRLAGALLRLDGGFSSSAAGGLFSSMSNVRSL
jgi:hypothetical protein